jgi:diguanylate cyclase (GGDEF)-like protein/PAS domain S-box-containing protein
VTKPVRLIVVDDSDDDAELVVRELRRSGWAPEYERVDKHTTLVKALHASEWDLVVADYSLPQLDALQTLEVLAQYDPNLPCVVVSGRTGEEAAVEVMQRGARDYVVKDRLGRLGPVVERVLLGAEERREKEATERALRELEQRFHSVVDTAMDAVITVDADGVIETLNPAAERLFGYGASDAVGHHIDTLLTEPHCDEPGPHFERVGRHKHGTTFPLEISLSEAEVAGRRIYTWIARDVRERKAFEAHLAEQALRDPLTGVANRTLLVDRITSTQSRASRRPASAALLFLDLDRFKVINDRYGHAAGDEVLRVVAKRLAALVRPADTIARLGGDEFVVLCEDIDGVAGAELIATRIAVALQSPVLVSGSDVVVSASIGIAVVDDPTLDADTLLRDADAAMYQAKEHGRDRFEIFDHEMRAQAFARTQIEHALHRALECEQLQLHYQPQRSLTTGDLVGFEALLRWDHPERGLLPPAQFLSVADETGVIVPIGEWAIGEACRQIARFTTQYDAPLTMWVNLSARQLVHADLVDNVATVLREVGSHVTLGIEITEDALMSDPGTAIAATRRLRDLGVRLAIDDFGTGYSSLHYVKLFPVDTLKIDRSFVQGVAADVQDAAIVSAIVGLSRALGLDVIAEGVEEPEQAATLRELGCDVAQGYYYARPLPEADAIDLLRREPAYALRSAES